MGAPEPFDPHLLVQNVVVLWPAGECPGSRRVFHVVGFVGLVVVLELVQEQPPYVVTAAVVEHAPAAVSGTTAAERFVFGAGALGVVVAVNRPLLVTDEGQISINMITMSVASALAFIQVRRTQQLVHRAARLGVSNARAQANLTMLMQGHHDALSVLSAALFSAARIADSDAGATSVATLHNDLARLRAALVELKERARSEATALGTPVAVDAPQAFLLDKQVFERALHPMHIQWDLPTTSVWALVAGGTRALQRVLMNLLVNAREGNGTVGATRCAVSVTSSADVVSIAVQDDGGGLPQGWSTLSTKRHGTGAGCAFMESIVSASGGTLAVETGMQGTLIVIRLLRVDPVRSVWLCATPAAAEPATKGRRPTAGAHDPRQP